MREAAVLAACYLLGSIPFGQLLYRAKTGRDIRKEGSGNIGATNVARMAGKTLGIVTLLFDAGKGYLAVMLTVWLIPSDWICNGDGPILWKSAAAVAVLTGHVFSIFLKFTGGKGVATALGTFGALAPWPVLATLVVFAIIVWRTRYVSLGSCVAAIAFPIAWWIMEHPPWVAIAGATVAAALIIVKHRANLERVMAGTENKF